MEDRGYDFKTEDVWNEVIITSIGGTEKLPVARKYEVELKAKGLARQTKTSKPGESWNHKAIVYVLDSYPYPTDKSKVGAPVRIVWLTPIFHPNISPGLEAKGQGVVCWGIMKEWTNLDTLYGIVKGLQLLIEHPNTKSPLKIDECQDAARWFDQNQKSLEGPKILGERSHK